MTGFEGLYKAEFMTPEHHGYGVLSMSQGLARGGDSIMCYDGRYRTIGTDVTLDLEVARHSHFKSMEPIFKREICTLTITAKRLEGDRIAGTGCSPEARDIPLKVILTKLRD